MLQSEIEYRCTECNKLLAKGSWEVAKLEIKCNRCGKVNSFFDDEEDQVIITDREGVILYVNQSLLNQTGYSLEETIGKTPALWGSQMPKEFYKDLWKRIKENKEVILVKLNNKKKNGEFYEAILRISPILDADGKPKFFLGIETVFDTNAKLVNHVKK